jgi:hypothetical protein
MYDRAPSSLQGTTGTVRLQAKHVSGQNDCARTKTTGRVANAYGSHSGSSTHVFDQRNEGRAVWIIFETLHYRRIRALAMKIDDAILSTMLGRHSMPSRYPARVASPSLLLTSDAIR